jgi:hypothetical protein
LHLREEWPLATYKIDSLKNLRDAFSPSLAIVRILGGGRQHKRQIAAFTEYMDRGLQKSVPSIRPSTYWGALLIRNKRGSGPQWFW